MKKVQKYKNGSLVTLSAAGMKNGHNDGFFTGFGVVTGYSRNHNYPYKLRWFNEFTTNREFNAKEYELKRYKAKK